ncbi:MAG: triose-phosphate isomerase [Patescibacteria group bacterium UBA2103]
MIIVGNFKSYLSSKDDMLSVVRAADKIETKHSIILAPSFVHLGMVADKKHKVSFAAQDISIFETGAHTGEVSAYVVANAGASHVILGHSERRAGGETDSIVATKVQHALAARLKVVLCVGEEERDMHANYLSFITEQIVSALKGVKDADFKNIVIAYEPIWAIGKDAAITPDHLEEMVLFIKKVLMEHVGEKALKAIKILYGGSVNPENVSSLMVPGVDGFLPGRASTNKDSLTALIKAIDA